MLLYTKNLFIYDVRKNTRKFGPLPLDVQIGLAVGTLFLQGNVDTFFD